MGIINSRTYFYFLICICIAATFVVFSEANAQNDDIGYPKKRNNPFDLQNILMQSSVVSHKETFPLNAARFFGTVTLTLATSTSIYTITTTTTCTTSTAAIKVCSPSKGRRRRDNVSLHRLIFEEEDIDGDDIFAPMRLEKRITEPKSTVEQDLIRSVGQTYEESLPIPFVVQPGFSRFPDYAGPGRFLIAFGTVTTISTTTSTYSYSLTATCSSTTGYQTCGTGYTSLYGRELEEDEFNK